MQLSKKKLELGNLLRQLLIRRNDCDPKSVWRQRQPSLGRESSIGLLG